MLLVAIVFAAFAAVGTVIALSSPIQVQTQNETATQLPVFPEEEAPPATATESGGGSILVQTPEPFNVTTTQESDSATIHVKLNLASENTTTVIPENGTVIQVPGNITVIDNDTVIISPDNETITEIDGNITVISPIPPEPCGCPVVNETAPATEEPADGIPDVIITPAPGQNVTEVPAAPSNETEVVAEPPAGNETAPIAGNETTTVTPAPGQNITILPAPPEGNDTASVEPASLTDMYENFLNRLQAS